MIENLGNKTYSHNKLFGKVYTPEYVVDLMLKEISDIDLRDKAICDPACGTGDFLVPIAKKLYEKYKTTKKEDYLKSLKTLTGYDIDLDALLETKRRLNRIVSDFKINWNLIHQDALDCYKTDQNKFDIVIGNPPYIRIQHLGKNRRDKIKNGNWLFFKGNSDLYLIFYELGLKILKEKGTLIYIAPSGWIRNKAGENMRRILLDYDIVSMYDFKSVQLFNKATTYSLIARICKEKPQHKEKIYTWEKGALQNDYDLFKEKDRWLIKPKKQKISKGVALKEIVDIRVGIQTLADKVFIGILKGACNSNFLQCDFNGELVLLEKEATKKIIKASVMKNGKDKFNRVVIYPYDQKGQLWDESFFKNQYPNTYNWLKINKKTLLNRDKGNFPENKWYGFGREVGIKTGFGKKILTSAMNLIPNFQISNDPDTLYYSGYSLKPKSEDIDWNWLLNILNNPKLDEHIKLTSQPFRNGWYSYAKRYLQDFIISETSNIEYQK